MICKNCSYEFCWSCGRKHPSHNTLIHTFKDDKKTIFLLTILVIAYLILLSLVEQVPALRILSHCPLLQGREVILVFISDCMICNIFLKKEPNFLSKTMSKLVLSCCFGFTIFFELYYNFLSIAFIQISLIFTYKFIRYKAKCTCKRRITTVWVDIVIYFFLWFL